MTHNKPPAPATQWKAPPAGLCAIGLIINMIYGVSSFTASDASPSCREFDWQFLFIYFSVYNIWLPIINSSDWNFMASALIFIDDVLIRDSVLLGDELCSEPFVVSVRVRLGAWHPRVRECYYYLLCLVTHTCVCVIWSWWMSTTDVSCDSKLAKINDKEQLRVKVVSDHLKEIWWGRIIQTLPGLWLLCLFLIPLF